MTLAIMQPYLFPYIGYFQLMHATQRFVVYDDVNYMKKGWVNRNNILENASSSLFTVPLLGASQNKKINETMVSPERGWRDKLYRRIFTIYSHAPQFAVVAPFIEKGIRREGLSIAEYNVAILKDVLSYLDIKTELILSSSGYGNEGLKGSDRILDICRIERANQYVNPIGGKELYDKAEFKAKGIDLYFLSTRPIVYKQRGHSFVPNLSILDVMMWNPPGQIREWLGQYDLV